tara:strand:+ start:321 stop:473 length:153 start_codon:yes stop_codon:yes gene_type:complete
MEFTDNLGNIKVLTACERFERYYIKSRKALNLQIKTNTSQELFTKYKKYN